MTAQQALETVRGYALANQYVISGHCRTRMAERNVSEDDIVHGLTSATVATEQENGRWKLGSTDVDGDELTLIVAIEGGVVVVTIF